MAAAIAPATVTMSLGAQRQPMIGAGAGRGRHALERVEPVHAVGALGPAPRGEIARVAQTARAAAEEVGVEREDDVGLVDAVLRLDVLAERELRAGAGVLAARRIPLVPLRGGKAREQIADLRGERRRAHRLGQDPQAGALERLLRRERGADRAEKRRPRPDLADVGERLRAIRIVEAEHAACAKTSVAPRLPGCSGLPSILVGRPSWLSTSSPVATPPSGIAVAKNSGLPGTISSGWRT